MRGRGAAVLLSIGALALVPQAAQAAYVTSVDTSVRPAEGSPWSKGTLFQGEGFQVGATTGNGWAWGRAKGEAERCGWVLISTLNSTTHTDTTCGAPSSEPLGDSEHSPGGGRSTWYVTCQSATLFGNYGGAAGNLRSPSGGVSYGQAVNWYYTTGNGYAASVDGPFNTPRFILRSCISRTPPGGGGPGPGPPPPPGADAELIGPPPWRLMDEEGLFALFGPGQLATASAFASAGKPRVARSRVTIRLAQGNIVIANGLEGDRFDASGVYCKGWVLGTVHRDSRPFTGWVQRSAFRPLPRRSKRDCSAPVKFDDRIGWVNAPFRSITWLHSKKPGKTQRKAGVRGTGMWGTTGSASQSRLRRDANGAVAADCGLYMNYNTAEQGGARFQDPVTPPVATKLFKRPEMAQTKGLIGYRYTTPGSGDAALVSLKTGHKKTMFVKRNGKRVKVTKNVGLWAFVKRSCVVPLSTYSNKPNASPFVWMPQIRICNKLKPSKAVRKFNKRKTRHKRLYSVAPCEYANSRTSVEKPQPDNATNGWLVGDLKLSG